MRKALLQLLCFISFLLLFSGFASAQEKDLEAYRPLLVKNAARLGITLTDVADSVIMQAYTDKATRIPYKQERSLPGIFAAQRWKSNGKR